MEIKETEIASQIDKAKKGNQSAYKFLLDYFWNYVYGFQISRVNNEFEAEEITIETFSKAFDKLNSYNKKYAFSTWLISISKNISIDRARKKNTTFYEQMTMINESHIKTVPDPNPTPEDILIKKQNLSNLLRFIKKLKPHYQEVIQLFYFQEMSYKEISNSIEEPLNNVKVRLLRARKLLSEIIIKHNN